MKFNASLTKDERFALIAPNVYAALNPFKVAAVRESLATKMQVDQNNLQQATSTLYSTVSQDVYFDETRQLLAPLKAFSTTILPDPISAPPGVNSVVNVEVVMSAGTSVKNATVWNTSALENRYVSVTMSRHSRPYAMSIDDMRHGERLWTKLGAAVNSVALGVYGDFTTTITDNLNTTTGSASATKSSWSSGTLTKGKYGNLVAPAGGISPEYVAGTLSQVFGEQGDVHTLALTPTAYAPLIPTNALSLQLESGVYGVGNIIKAGKLAGIAGSSKTTLGIVSRREAMVMTAGLPDLSPLGSIVDVQQLSSEQLGIPMLLKTWIDPNSEVVRQSVEAMVGFAPVETQFLYVIQAAS